MSPVTYTDMLKAERRKHLAERSTKDGKLGDAPEHDTPPSEIAMFLALGYGLPEGYDVVRVVRHGGRAGTGLTVFVGPPEGEDLQINYDRESDCYNPAKLRAQAAADTKGLTRGNLIASPKAALAMYEALCSLADHFEAANERGTTWEWVQHLHRVAAITNGETTSYWALRQLQGHDYSKRLVERPPVDEFGRPQRPVPALLKDEAGRYYVTARHMAVFLRYDLGVEGAGDDDRILTRLSAIGGERLDVQEWDSTGRDRRHKVTLVLYRLPEEAPDDDPE